MDAPAPSGKTALHVAARLGSLRAVPRGEPRGALGNDGEGAGNWVGVSPVIVLDWPRAAKACDLHSYRGGAQGTGSWMGVSVLSQAWHYLDPGSARR